MRRISRRTLISTAATAAAIASTRCSEPRPAEAPSVPTLSKSEQFVGKFVEDMGAGARAGIGSDINEGMLRGWSQMAGLSRFRKLVVNDDELFEMRI